MGTCPACGSPTTARDRHCAACGAALPEGRGRPCPACGTPAEPGDRHCRACGRPLPRPPEPDATAPLGEPAPRRDTEVLPAVEPFLAPRSRDARAVEAEREPRPGQRQPPAPRPAPTPIGGIVAFAASLAVIASGFLEWRTEVLGGGTGAEVPLRFLADPEAAARRGEWTIALLLLVLGAVGAMVALLTIVVPRLRRLRGLVGVLTLVVPAAFVVRTEIALGLLGGSHPFLESFGPGVWLAVGASVMQVVAGRLRR